MIVCKALDKEFQSKELMFAELKANKAHLIASKKAQILKSFEKGTAIAAKSMDVSKIECTKSIEMDDNFYYLAVNTTNVLDSHQDLHVKGIWNRTVKNQQGLNYLVLDHEVKVSTTVVRKEHIEMFVAEIPFAAIGKSYKGNTEALIYKFPKDKVKNQEAKEWLESGDALEASVRMQYVKVRLAMNSDSKDDVDEKKAYDETIDVIANKADFESIDYYFIIEEAKNVMESSLVPFGSNGATGQINNNSQPEKSTEIEEIKEIVADTSLNTLLTNIKIQ
ncbi:structural protein [Cellulophaga phage phi19:1]|uniref:Structural protein n=1 Tax=Cellulophaga phage phi19:1 TaxID=1327970 RepID=R9ZYG3_9CAUD|nr:structural protein [Cellulophaga phage phi19:1]AGO47377.1 structural protein [Cellulophaga phage phi19:1]